MTTKGLTNFKIYRKKQTGFSSSYSDSFHRTIIQEDPNDKSNIINFKDRYIFVKKIKTSIILPPIKLVVGRIYTIVNQIELEDDRTIPNITVDIIEILDTIVKLNINLISSGNNIREVGVEYKNITTNVSNKISRTFINFPIEFILINLEPDTDYECFIYAINNIGTQNVNKNFKTYLSPSPPIFEFELLSNTILDTSCKLKLDLISDGRTKLTSVSIFYGYSSINLFLKDDIDINYFYNSSSYLHVLNNLYEGTLYYYKVRVVNDAGSFEEIQSFTTLQKVNINASVKKVTPTNILINLNINKGIVSISHINVYYENKIINIDIIENQGLYDIFIDNLDPDTTYNIKIEVVNKINSSIIEINQKTNIISRPEINSELILVSLDSAIVRINIESNGGSELESVNLLVGSSPTDITMNINGELPIENPYTDIDISYLIKGTQYFYKAIVKNNESLTEGISEGYFLTLSDPDITTKFIVKINSINIELKVNSTGSSNINSMYIKYKNENETQYKIAVIENFNNPKITLSELQNGLTYTIMSYVSNIAGGKYEKTDIIKIPNISSDVILENNTAIIDIVIDSGNFSIIEKGIKYELSEDNLDNNLEYDQIIYNNNNKFYLENLILNERYYYKIYAKNTEETIVEIKSNFIITANIVDPFIDIQIPSIVDPFIDIQIPSIVDPIMMNTIQSVILHNKENHTFLLDEKINIEGENKNIYTLEVMNESVMNESVMNESVMNESVMNESVINEITNNDPVETQITEIIVIPNEGDNIISTLDNVINRDIGKSFFAQQVKNSDGTFRYFWSIINI